MSCGKVNLVSPLKVGKKITPTKRFLYMSKMYTVISKKPKMGRDSNDLTVKGKKDSKAEFNTSQCSQLQ